MKKPRKKRIEGNISILEYKLLQLVIKPLHKDHLAKALTAAHLRGISAKAFYKILTRADSKGFVNVTTNESNFQDKTYVLNTKGLAAMEKKREELSNEPIPDFTKK